MSLYSKSITYLHAHPVCLSALGMAPLIAQSRTLLSAFTIGITFSTVLLLSAISVSLIRNLIPQQYRLAFILPVASVWVTVADLLLQAFVYEIRINLAIYIPLIAMNSFVLMLLEANALRTSVLPVIKLVLHSAVGVLFVSLLTGGIREILTRGVLLTDISLLLPMLAEPANTVFLTLPLFNTAAGGFIILGCVIAMINLLYLRVTKPASAD